VEIRDGGLQIAATPTARLEPRRELDYHHDDLEPPPGKWQDPLLWKNRAGLHS
jgi:hypothetical protein